MLEAYSLQIKMQVTPLISEHTVSWQRACKNSSCICLVVTGPGAERNQGVFCHTFQRFATFVMQCFGHHIVRLTADLDLVEFCFENGSIYLRLEGCSFRAAPLFLRKCSLVN